MRPACLGIVGGMGPLASAEFLRTIYRENVEEREQTAPRCLMVSDPTFPDRTAALLRGARGELVDRLQRSVSTLVEQGATRVVVACFTIHEVIDELPSELRDRVVSLVDLTIEELRRERRSAADEGPRLLLTTTGTHRCGVFSRHPRWPEVALGVSPLNAQDRDELHALLYRLKRGADPARELSHVRALERRYGARGSIFGCTELHLLQSPLDAQAAPAGPRPIDALRTVARHYREIMEHGGRGPGQGTDRP